VHELKVRMMMMMRMMMALKVMCHMCLLTVAVGNFQVRMALPLGLVQQHRPVMSQLQKH